MTCDSTACSSLDVLSCRNNTGLYQASYGDESYTVGDFATEFISFAGGDASSISNIAFCCCHDNEGLFVVVVGLLGLSYGRLSLPSQILAKSFSYYLINRDSSNTSTLNFESDLE